MANEPINLYDYEARANLALPHDTWDFIDAGAMDEFTTKRNRSAFDQLTLRPRFMRSVEERKISTTMLGEDLSFPVFVCPAGSHGVAHPDAEVATARAAGRSNTLMMLSTSSNCSMEEVAEAATGPLWFQLYHRGAALTEMLVHRAEEAGFKAIVLTVDTPVPSPKERDLRNQFERKLELGNFRDLGLAQNEISGTDETPGWDVSRADPITWNDLEWLRGLTSLPLVLKGVRVAEDAKIAADMGGEGIHPRRTAVGSDHGCHRDGPRDRRSRKRQLRGIPGLRRAPWQRCAESPRDGRKGRGHRPTPVLGSGHRGRRRCSQHLGAASGRGRQGHGLLRPERCGQPGVGPAQHSQQLGTGYGLSVD